MCVFCRVRQEAEANKLLLTKEFLDYSRALAIGVGVGGWVGGWVWCVRVCPITDLVCKSDNLQVCVCVHVCVCVCASVCVCGVCVFVCVCA